MKADIIPLVVGLLIFISSLVSLKLGLSVAIIELLLGVIAGNLGLQAEEWMMYLAGFGGIVLTFLAGTEIDARLMKEKFKESFLIGIFSFLIPFIGVFLYTYYYTAWSLHASLIAGTALSTTSLAVVYFANVGNGHAVLPAFVLGLLMSRHFIETSETKVVRNRLRTVAYAIVTPIFFIVGGLKVSAPLIISAFGLFVILFVIKLLTKFIGVYFFAKKYIPDGSMYTTLLMSTGLTFGTIASVFGLQSGFINQEQYSVLVGVVVASAVIPTFIAQKWFMPVHSEDLVDLDSENSFQKY